MNMCNINAPLKSAKSAKSAAKTDNLICNIICRNKAQLPLFLLSVYTAKRIFAVLVSL